MNKPVILCVDDEKFVLDSLKEQLKSGIRDHEIYTAEGGTKALELVKELLDEGIEIPIIISDHSMPSMNGDKLLEEIHSISPETITILLIGQGTTKRTTNILNTANLSIFISKPWKKRDLHMIVREALRSFYRCRQIKKQNDKLEKHACELMGLINSFVETMVSALDTRDPLTYGHSQRLSKYILVFAKAINETNFGKYKDFFFSKDEINELYYSALLHDIGKIGIKENILLKRYKLTEERQNLIKYRFNYYKKYLQLKNNRDKNENKVLENIDEYLDFIIKISRKNYITKEEIDMVKKISKVTFVDIDHTRKCLLDDFELENLTIEKGNLTDTERKIINEHVDYTYNILNSIAWTDNLKNIPTIASCHHERIDGTGYNKGLTENQIPIEARMLAILDVFDALIATDRTYKLPMSISEALEVLQEEVNLNHLDKDLFDIFIKKGIYNTLHG